MKKLLFVFVFGFTITGLSFAFQNEPDGFRGIKWGINISADSNEMTLIYESGNEKRYRRTNDEMSIGRAKLDDIHYLYWKDKFYGVSIYSSGEDNFLELLVSFINVYGDNFKRHGSDNRYLWEGKTAYVSLECGDCEPIGCITLISSQKMRMQKKKEEEAAIVNKQK